VASKIYLFAKRKVRWTLSPHMLVSNIYEKIPIGRVNVSCNEKLAKSYLQLQKASKPRQLTQQQEAIYVQPL